MTTTATSPSPHGGRAPLAWLPRPTRQHVPILATIAVFLLLYAGASVRYDTFFTSRGFENLLRASSVWGLTAIGMTFVILSGGIDLSVGAVVSLVSIAVAVLIERAGVHPAAVIPTALLFGVAFGAGQGALIAFFALPPFLVTLAGLFLARGLALIISRESLTIAEPLYARASEFSFDVFPVTAIVFIVVLAAAMWVAHQTRFGRAVYAIGGNETSALFMGVAVRRTKVMVYALSGGCAALAGVMFTFATESGRPVAGELWELDAIAAVVIGGTLLTGGVGYVAGTLVGVLILGLIGEAITWEGDLNTWWTRITIGGLLLAFILMQRLIQSRAAA